MFLTALPVLFQSVHMRTRTMSTIEIRMSTSCHFNAEDRVSWDSYMEPYYSGIPKLLLFRLNAFRQSRRREAVISFYNKLCSIAKVFNNVSAVPSFSLTTKVSVFTLHALSLESSCDSSSPVSWVVEDLFSIVVNNNLYLILMIFLSLIQSIQSRRALSLPVSWWCVPLRWNCTNDLHD